MSTLQEAEKLLSVMTRAEKAQLLQWLETCASSTTSTRIPHPLELLLSGASEGTN